MNKDIPAGTLGALAVVGVFDVEKKPAEVTILVIAQIVSLLIQVWFALRREKRNNKDETMTMTNANDFTFGIDYVESPIMRNRIWIYLVFSLFF